MNILGPDELIFGVEDIELCSCYLQDYGLKAVGSNADGGRFEALDGTAVVLRRAHDANLPAVLGSGPASFLRETIYGVGDHQTLNTIADEMRKDRDVRFDSEGGLHTFDDSGFAIAFRQTCRRPYDALPVLSNAPGVPPQRLANQVAVDPAAEAKPRTLSHVVYFVPDAAKAESFYVNRLQFRVTDRFAHVGPFLRPAGLNDHHSLFLIETPNKMLGLEHFAFHLASGTEVLAAGTRFVGKGYQSHWGPGRHIFGSNWFWYFNSPLGCKIEYDADMDTHDDSWVPREFPISADSSQIFLFETRAKWAPVGPPPK